MEFLSRFYYEILVLSALFGHFARSQGSPSVDLIADKHGKERRMELKILPEPRSSTLKTLLYRVNDTLNLTCKVVLANPDVETPDAFKISWTLPSTPANHTYQHLSNTEINLVVFNVQPEDGGDYICGAESDGHQEELLRSKVVILVKNRKVSCGDSHFSCSLNECIPKRYACDGKKDCRNAEDEAITLCGEAPCGNKIVCDNGRCIPRSLCCDRYLDKNCSTLTKLPCCFSVLHSYDSPYADRLPEHFIIHTENSKGIDLLQSTIFTVVGCSLAFVFIVTILVIAICRVQMRRTAFAHISRIPNSHHTYLSRHRHNHCSRGRPGSDLNMDSYNQVFANHMANFMVTYNINNGIHMVGHPVNPPPYSEVMSMPSNSIPPPPYASVDNLHDRDINISNESDPRVFHPLLEDNNNNGDDMVGFTENNNGDINGNSVDVLPEFVLLTGGSHRTHHFH